MLLLRLFFELVNMGEGLSWAKVKELYDRLDLYFIGDMALATYHAKATNEPLPHDSLHGTSDQKWLDIHVEQTWECRGGVVGVECTEY
jgi:hypothetical protein